VEGLAGVVFDLDGVLVDSIHVMRRAFQRAYEEVVGGGEAPFGTYCRYLGWYFPDIMRAMGLPLEMEAPFVRESVRLMDEVGAFDGVSDILAGLRATGLRLSIATGKHGWRARKLLDRLDLAAHLDAVVGGDDVARPKPAPDSVLLALSRMGVPARRAVMVGDAVADLRSGRAAGTRTAAALWGQGADEELLAEAPDLVFARPADLLLLAGRGAGRA
jgi:AHBA synthesis associated protein